MNIKKYNYIIIPFILLVVFLFVAYFGNQWYAMTFGNPGVDYSYIFLSFNEKMPFLAWTIYPYVLAYPFWALTFIYISTRSKENMYKILTMSLVTFIICGIWYFFWQSDVESWRLTSGLFINNDYATPRTDLNFTESLVIWIYNAAGPRNALPSMHTLMSWLCILTLRLDKKVPIWPKVIIWTLSLTIIIATQTLKQHYIIDLIVGIILAEAAYWILKDSKLVKIIRGWIENLNVKLKLEK
jgi:membrane-associated phospholipid phosphatase